MLKYSSAGISSAGGSWNCDATPTVHVRLFADNNPMDLFNASGDGNLKKVKKLLMAGVPFDWQHPSSGYTPLIVAAENGHHEVVELLLTKGALVNHHSGSEFFVPSLSLVYPNYPRAIPTNPNGSHWEGGEKVVGWVGIGVG